MNLQFNPIIVRELRARMRGLRPYIILSSFLLGMAAAGVALYILLTRPIPDTPPLLSAQIGKALFGGLALVELALVVFVAPVLTSGAISGERERLTYDMLMATPLHPAQLLWGKLLAALCYLLLLIFTAAPLFSVVIIFGGIAVEDVPHALTLLLMTALTFGSIGMLCSSLEQRTIRATMMSYLLTLVLIVGSLFGHRLWTTGTTLPDQARRSGAIILSLNPFSAMISITTNTTDPRSSFGRGQISPLPLFANEQASFIAPLTQGVVVIGENGPVVLPIYRATFLLYPLLTLLTLWLSMHLVRPKRRWRLGWADLVFLLLLLGGAATLALTRGWWQPAAV